MSKSAKYVFKDSGLQYFSQNSNLHRNVCQIDNGACQTICLGLKLKEIQIYTKNIC